MFGEVIIRHSSSISRNKAIQGIGCGIYHSGKSFGISDSTFDGNGPCSTAEIYTENRQLDIAGCTLIAHPESLYLIKATGFAGVSLTDSTVQQANWDSMLCVREASGKINALFTDDSCDSIPSISSGACRNFAVHARSTITFAGPESTITHGDIGVAPGTSITGEYVLENGEMVSESSDFAAAAKLNHAEKMSEQDDCTNMVVTEIGGLTLTPGTYCFASAINVAFGTKVVLDGQGDKNAMFLFQAGSTFVTAAITHFDLIHGAKAENIIWALGTAATLGAGSIVEGSILAGSAITFGTGSVLHGCAIAQTAVTFETLGIVDLPTHS